MSSQEDQPKKLILRRHRDCTSLEEVCSQTVLQCVYCGLIKVDIGEEFHAECEGYVGSIEHV